MRKAFWGALVLLGAGFLALCSSGVFRTQPAQHAFAVDGDRLILTSPSGYQTVSMVDGGRTGLYYDAPEDLLLGMPGISRVALLGLGGGEMLRAARRAQPTAKLIGVEIDQHTVELAEADFGLAELGATAVHADALEWIHSQAPGSLSVVMVDLFNDSEMVERSAHAPFFADCARALPPFGLYLQNVWPPERAAQIELELAPYFDTARKSYGANVIIAGMKRP